MPKLLHSQKSFNGGAISPRLHGRTDLGVYQTGLKTAENIVLGTEGHMRKRNGTQYIAEVETSANKSRLVPFQFSQTQSVVLEFGDTTLRFFADKAQILDTGVPYEITTPYSSSDLPNITYTQFANVMYIACEGIPASKLTRTSELIWTLEEISSYDLFDDNESLVVAGVDDMTIRAGDDATIVDSLVRWDFDNYAGVAQIGERSKGLDLTLVGSTGRAVILTESSGSVSVTIKEAFSSNGPFTAAQWQMEGTALQLDDLAPKNHFKVEGSADLRRVATSGEDPTLPTDVGKFIAYNGGVIKITSISTGTQPGWNGYTIKTLSSLDTTDTIKFVAEDETPTYYPNVVGIYDQRLVFANTTNNPQSVWMSQYQKFNTFIEGLNSNDGIRVDVGTGEYSAISWLASSNDLLVGGARAETSIKGNNGVLTPTTAEPTHRSAIGSAVQVPVQVDNETLFISNTNRVYSIRYNFDVNSYVPQDLSMFSEHLTNDGLGEMAYAKRPDKTIHVVTDTGDMMVGTFSREEQVIGWSLYVTDGSYESVASIRESGEDQVWVVVNRTIDGATARYVEVFDQGTGTSTIDGFSDSYLTYTGAATATLTGLEHLEGEVVEIKIDGGTHVSKTVTSGEVTLGTSTTSATIGMPYTMTVETLPVEKQLASDSVQGQQVSWVEPILRVYNSAYPTINGHARTIRVADNSNMDEGPILATGLIKYANVDASTLLITDTGPLPIFINSISGEVDVSF